MTPNGAPAPVGCIVNTNVWFRYFYFLLNSLFKNKTIKYSIFFWKKKKRNNGKRWLSNCWLSSLRCSCFSFRAAFGAARCAWHVVACVRISKKLSKQTSNDMLKRMLRTLSFRKETVRIKTQAKKENDCQGTTISWIIFLKKYNYYSYY